MNKNLPRCYPQLFKDFDKYSLEFLAQTYEEQASFYANPDKFGACEAATKLEDTFNKFDKSGDGELDFGEVKQMLQYHAKKYEKSDRIVTDRDVEDFYSDIDEYGDHEITMNEWKHFMFRHLANSLCTPLRTYLFDCGFEVIDLKHH